MKIIVQLVKSLAVVYALAFVGSAFWAWVTYLGTKDAETEHLLPSFIFNIVCLPSSLLMERFIDWYPDLLDSPLLQYSLVTLLGLLQFACLVLIALGLNRFTTERSRAYSGDVGH